MSAHEKESFLCPITLEVMRDPVMDRDGNTFERATIEEWIAAHGTSPLTMNPMRLEDLTPNRALKNAIEEDRKERESKLAEASAPPLPSPPSAPLTLAVVPSFDDTHLARVMLFLFIGTKRMVRLTRSDGLYSFVGGEVHSSETVWAALKRLCKEQIGFVPHLLNARKYVCGPTAVFASYTHDTINMDFTNRSISAVRGILVEQVRHDLLQFAPDVSAMLPLVLDEVTAQVTRPVWAVRGDAEDEWWPYSSAASAAIEQAYTQGSESASAGPPVVRVVVRGVDYDVCPCGPSPKQHRRDGKYNTVRDIARILSADYSI